MKYNTICGMKINIVWQKRVAGS